MQRNPVRFTRPCAPQHDPSRSCVRCHERAARFRYRHRVRRDRSHELCFRCFRSVLDASRATRLVTRSPSRAHTEVNLAMSPLVG